MSDESSTAQRYLDGLAPGSRAAMGESLKLLADFFSPGSARDAFPWHTLRVDRTRDARTWLTGHGFASRTVNRHLAALRGVLKECWGLGLMSTDEYHRAIDIKTLKVDEPPKGRRLGIDEIRRLVLKTEDHRDSAIIALMYAAGLRRFEVTKLRVMDYDRSIGQISVRGKGNKVREITINKGWRQPINRWFDEYAARSDAPLFPSRHHGHVDAPMVPQSIAYIIGKWRQKHGVAKLTAHDMRRTFITDLIEIGTDLVVVKRLAGHASIETTASYDRRGRAAEDAAVSRLAPLLTNEKDETDDR